MGQEEARDEGSTPVKEPSPDPVVGVAGSGSAEDAEVPVHSLLPATEGTAEVHTGDANAEAYRVVSSGEAATVEPIVEPAGDDAPRVVPPEMFDEILDGLINDDLLEVGLMKEMRGSGTQPSC